MDHSTLCAFLERVRTGKLSIAQAAARLAELPYADLGFAKFDHHRTLRCGMPEVIFGQGKSVQELLGILDRARIHTPVVLATRLSDAQQSAVASRFPDAQVNVKARTARIGSTASSIPGRHVAVVTAGTSDIPVAEEAAETLEAFGCRAERAYDMGVAGIHRLLHLLPSLRKAAVLIVVAGMEGALPSVVGGLVRVPVIAVPSSVGYGASLGGIAALLGMLNTCSAGVTVVNIDNGFGAAAAALRILNGTDRKSVLSKGSQPKTKKARSI